MDNFHISVTAEGRASLSAALFLAFAHNAPGGNAEAYAVDDEKGLVFLWSKSQAARPGRGPVVPLLFKLDANRAADFAERWLADQDFGEEPDHDGHNVRGWHVYCETWGHVGELEYAICAVKPAWAQYGK